MSRLPQYGPVNCNVARTRNGEPRPLTCERCGKLNTSDCSSSELADGCLFYRHELGFGFKSIVGAERKLVSQETLDGVAEAEGLIGHSAPEPIPAGVYFSIDNFYDINTRRGMGHDFWRKWCARKSEFPADSQPKPHSFDAQAVSFKPANVGIRTTRVQRARIMDRIEQALHDAKADLNSHSVEKETEQLTKDILDILNAS